MSSGLFRLSSRDSQTGLISRLVWNWGLGFGVWGLGFGVWGLWLRASGFWFRIPGLRFRVSGFGLRVLGFGFRVSGFGFRVSGWGSTPGKSCAWLRGSSLPRDPRGKCVALGSPLLYPGGVEVGEIITGIVIEKVELLRGIVIEWGELVGAISIQSVSPRDPKERCAALGSLPPCPGGIMIERQGKDYCGHSN